MKNHQFYEKTVSIGILNIFQKFRLLTRAAPISSSSVAGTYPAIVTGYARIIWALLKTGKEFDGNQDMVAA